MTVDAGLKTLGVEGLRQFHALQADAVTAVTERFYATHGSVYERFGARGRDACREDLTFHLEFLRPVLEFGLLQPMVDYLNWLRDVLAARKVPADHLDLSLTWLAEFMIGRMDAANGSMVGAALLSARTKFLDRGAAPLAPPIPPEPWPEMAAFEAALLAGDQRAALAVVNRCMDDGNSLVDVELHIIQPALYAIGEKWKANQVTIAQEHLGTAIVQSVMTMAMLRSPPPVPINRRALLACVEGNDHTIGLRMVADALHFAGWDVQNLGANMPTLSLVNHAAEWTPDLVGLSVSLPQQLRVVKAVISLLDERLGSARPAVIVGGLALNRFNALSRVVGAAAFGADPKEAVVQARRLVAGRPRS